MELTGEQKKEVWEWCGQQPKNRSEYGRCPYIDYPPVNLITLFQYAVPKVLNRLESRFDAETNRIRALELLFPKWIDKIRDGYSFEDALLWVIWEVIHGS